MPKYHYATAVLFAASVSCANSTGTEDEPLTPASQVVSTEDNGVESRDEELADAQECQSNEDCGKGFVCGFDPGRSHVMKYCM